MEDIIRSSIIATVGNWQPNFPAVPDKFRAGSFVTGVPVVPRVTAPRRVINTAAELLEEVSRPVGHLRTPAASNAPWGGGGGGGG